MVEPGDHEREGPRNPDDPPVPEAGSAEEDEIVAAAADKKIDPDKLAQLLKDEAARLVWEDELKEKKKPGTG